MFSRTRITIIIGLVLLMAAPTLAGISPGTPELDSFEITSANCESITVTFRHSVDEPENARAFTFLGNVPNNITVSPGNPVPSSPSAELTFTLSPALPNGTTIFVETVIIDSFIEIGSTGSRFLAKPSRLGGLQMATSIDNIQGDFEEPSPSIVARSSQTITVDCDAESTSSAPGCPGGRLNTWLCEPLAIYAVSTDDGDGMILYNVDRGDDAGEFELYIAAEDLDAAREAGTEDICTLGASNDGDVVVYLLEDGRISAAYGPDGEGKIFQYFFESYPAKTSAYETQFGSDLPQPDACAKADLGDD